MICGLLPNVIEMAGPDSENFVCELFCKPGWIDGRAPEKGDATLPAFIRDSLALSTPRLPDAPPLPHPDHCDHMERPLPPFDGCCDQRTWQCALHGDVRLSDCQRGEKGCRDFRHHDTPPDAIIGL
jgi:hypothetical protein